MQFRFDRFYRINRRVFIWAAIVGLIYILRDFFGLIFLTFLIVSFTLPVINYFQRETKIRRTFIIVILYSAIFFGLIGLFIYVTPRVTSEATNAAWELQAIQSRVERVTDDITTKTPALAPLLREVMDDAQTREYMNNARRNAFVNLLRSGRLVAKAISTLFLSLLFSFLIVLDLSRLTGEMRKIERSRLHALYEEIAGPVVRFFSVVAQAFRAQAMIAVTNTVLTLVGFLILQLPSVTLLTIVVFFFSFIPVLGVFISTTPAVLVAFNSGGYEKAVGVIILVTIIHLIEAYVLNPLIYGKHLKLNPVLVLLILYVGHHFFGIWGMLLGVPVSYYALYYVFKLPREEEEPEPLLTSTTVGVAEPTGEALPPPTEPH